MAENKTAPAEKAPAGRPRPRLLRGLWLALGCVCLGLGVMGIVVPVLPTTPFFLVTLVSFAKGSQKLHDWFVSTALYHKHLERYVKKEGMEMRTKCTIVASVTALMAVGFGLMARRRLWVPCGILAAVWIGHMVYFFGVVKTIPAARKQELCEEALHD